ncbi:MAG: T9SS type A sorting domain-containing protein [Eudoraea sp.]|nr:T9SS type A sorting domain-containing protein [Eudoraea sp.]MBT8209256.1 T9SS type A sorting domain-containing protein [Eudoraea sp.]MBT8311312.1 T9SS type A sorting domain-containing protein [Eudoraea sp.]NNJ37715.1 T9SS type A sorting domain-containing protein [Flavobacteriaceae bacterium]NNK29411.1 T9SS type A sorting domain-containing protein [Flavobacteriaceae bacterium]
MKLIYLFLLLGMVVSVSAQDTVDVASVSDTQIADFKLYPNPAFNNVVYITTKDNGIKKISIYDVFGKVVLTDRIRNNALDISRLIPGVYVIQVIENKKTMTRKLVVK